MPYRRAFTTLGCPDLSLEQAIGLARQHGIDALELRALKGNTDLPLVLGGAYGTPADLAGRLRESPVRIVSLDTSFKAAVNTPADRDDLLRFVPWAEGLGVPWLRVFDGGEAADPESLHAMAATVDWWRAVRKQHGWRTDLMVETHDSLFTAAAIRQFLALAPGTAILWDTHHTWKKGGEDPLVTWRAAGAHVVHVHVKDSIAHPSARHPFTYVLPGEGEFPMAQLRPVLQAEFSGAVCLEWEKLWHPYLGPLEDALAAAGKGSWW